MKHWQIIAKIKNQKSKIKTKDIINTLLRNRGLTTKEQVEEFLNPPNPLARQDASSAYTLSPKPLGIDSEELKKAIERISHAVKTGGTVIVYGDFDADGICGTAILWETLNNLGAKVMPYIPHRLEEGYGLSQKGIDNLRPKPSLILTVDNGITAAKAVDYARKHGIEVIITDHHQKPKVLPNAYATVWTDKLSGAGVAWFLAKELATRLPARQVKQCNNETMAYLDLASLATIADLSPLTGANRALVKFGLEELNKTQRAGLLALMEEAGLELGKIGVWEVGHILAPRLNATGRLTHAMDSLRLLCTRDPQRARDLAQKLGATNRERQQLTEDTTLHAKDLLFKIYTQTPLLIFIHHPSYNQGVIGLVAGKLVDEFYRPAIVVSQGKTYSKASARSINGFNIVETIRQCADILVDVGGHPMAAGFTVETRYLLTLKSRLEEIAQRELSEEKLQRALKIDCEIDFEEVNWELYDQIQKMAPFGIGNPEPVFLTSGVAIKELRQVGMDNKHLKLTLRSPSPYTLNPLPSFDAIAFGQGKWAGKIAPGDKIDIVYTISADIWNGEEKLQLKIKDLTLSLPKGQ